LDLPRSVGRHVSVKQRQRGLDQASYVESFLILNAAGGECLTFKLDRVLRIVAARRRRA